MRRLQRSVTLKSSEMVFVWISWYNRQNLEAVTLSKVRTKIVLFGREVHDKYCVTHQLKSINWCYQPSPTRYREWLCFYTNFLFFSVPQRAGGPCQVPCGSVFHHSGPVRVCGFPDSASAGSSWCRSPRGDATTHAALLRQVLPQLHVVIMLALSAVRLIHDFYLPGTCVTV